MLVEIRSINRVRWHDIPAEKSIAQPLSFTAAVDGNTMRYKVALSEEQLSEIAGRTGYDLSLSFKPSQPHPFWDSPMMRIRLNRGETNIINVVSDIDVLKLAVIKGSGLVAPSINDIGEHYQAEFYIYSEEDEVQRTEAKATLVMNAFKKLEKLSESQKQGVLRILTRKRNVLGRSADFVNTMLFNSINEDPEAFIEYATMTPTRVKSLVLIEESVAEGFLQKEGTSYFYGSDRIGLDRKEAAAFLEEPQNQPMRLRLMELCNIK